MPITGPFNVTFYELTNNILFVIFIIGFIIIISVPIFPITYDLSAY